MTTTGKKVRLTEFEGHEVLSATIAITNAGDGLSKAMEVDPIEFEHGERVYVVLECEVAKIRFDPIPDTEKGLQRVHVLRAGDATIVEADLVKNYLSAQRKRIEDAKGQTTLDFGEEAGGEEGDGSEGAEESGEPMTSPTGFTAIQEGHLPDTHTSAPARKGKKK